MKTIISKVRKLLIIEKFKARLYNIRVVYNIMGVPVSPLKLPGVSHHEVKVHIIVD